jgi:hypothetical protein
MTQLSDKEFEELKSSINNAIHELVFCSHHAEENEMDEARDNLTAAQLTLEEVGNKIQSKLV